MVRRAGTLLVGSGGSQLVALGLAPLLTRLYDPHAFGAFGIFVAVTTLAASIGSLGLENALVIERDEAQARVAFGASLVLAVAVACAATGLTAAAWLADVLPALPARALGLVGPSVLALGWGQVLANRALSLDRPGAVAAGRLLRGAGVGIVQLALAWHAANGVSLIEGGLAGQTLAAAATAWALRSTPGPLLGTRERRRRLATHHRTLLRWSAPQTLLNNLGNSAVPPIIGGIGGAASVGAFTLANRVVLLPAVTIGEAMRQSLLASMSRIAGDDASLRRMTARTSLALAVPLGLLAVVLLVVGPALFAVVFGAQWRAAGFDAGLLMAAQAAGIANIPAVTVITVRGWQRSLFAFGAVTLPIRLAALALAGSVTSALIAWCALSALASAAVTIATLVRLGPGTASRMEEVAG